MTPEFTAAWDYGRARWVIRRHGQDYAEIPYHPRRYPAHTERYVRRVVGQLNGATDAG